MEYLIHKPSLMCIYCHPDDETLMSGTIARSCRNKVKVSLVCVTDGTGAIPEGMPPDVRIKEMQETAKVLGVSDLRMPGWMKDASFEGYDHFRLIENITALIREIRPDVIITFPPDGITQHPNHIALHHAVESAFKLSSIADKFTDQLNKGLRAFSPGKLYYMCVVNKPLLRLLKTEVPVIKMKKRMDWKTKKCSPTLKLDVSAFADIRIKAMNCHRTQKLDKIIGTLTKEDRDKFLNYEYFHLAVSNIPNLPSQETDIFDGLR